VQPIGFTLATQYLRPIIGRLTIRNTAWKLGLTAVTVALAAAAPAMAAPAGDEYLPKVPKAAGKELAAGQDGAGGSILEPAVRGAQGTGDQKNGDQNGDTPDSAALGSAGSSSGGGSGADALLDPVVLLVIAGVLAATIGMTLRRRQSDLGQSAAGGDDASRKTSNDRPTPDGGIDGDDDDES
jgi:hypothetical protein